MALNVLLQRSAPGGRGPCNKPLRGGIRDADPRGCAGVRNSKTVFPGGKFRKGGCSKMNENIIISLKDIVVDFDGQKVLDGLSLDIHDNEFVTCLGPSGCG